MSSGKTPVCMHDIADAEAFVYTMMRRALPTAILTPETREELLQTGMLLLQGMANRDKSQSGSGDHDAGSKFSGYASRFLPGKIRDAWHKMEGHTLKQGPEGKREWVINDKPISLEGIMEGQNDSAADTIVQLRAPADRGEPEEERVNLAQSLGVALDNQYANLRTTTIQVALMVEEGLTHAQVARKLGITEREVGAAVSRIMTISTSMMGLQVA